jgi:hypothetical protein
LHNAGITFVGMIDLDTGVLNDFALAADKL